MSFIVDMLFRKKVTAYAADQGERGERDGEDPHVTNIS